MTSYACGAVIKFRRKSVPTNAAPVISIVQCRVAFALVEKASGVRIENSKLMLQQSQKFNTSAQSAAIVAQRLAL
eukprot:16247-Heterococcus_DN1.PRE.6